MKTRQSRILLRFALLIAIATSFLCLGGPLADREKSSGQEKELRPETRPDKPSANDLTHARKDSKYKAFFASYDEIIGLYREKQALTNANDPNVARKAKSRLPRIDRKLQRAKRDLYKIAERLRRPLDREHDSIQNRADDYGKKAEEAEKRKLKDRAAKFNEEQDTYNIALGNLQKQIDLINYHLFFDEFEPEGDDLNGKSADDDKKDKGMKRRH